MILIVLPEDIQIQWDMVMTFENNLLKSTNIPYMKKLLIYLEINGIQVYIGDIIYNNQQDAGFAYANEYLMSKSASPISISLPLQEERFSTQRTRNFFEGLLPEGFTRRTVAQWMHVSEDDYLSILKWLQNLIYH